MYQPIEDLATSLQSALLRDLPPVNNRVRDYEAWNKISLADQKRRMALYNKGEKLAVPHVMKPSRPKKSEVRVTMFVQTWPTDALGFLNKARDDQPAEAYTVVVEHAGTHAVYFAGRFAFLVTDSHAGGVRSDMGWMNFQKDLAKRSLCDCAQAVSQYKAISVNKYGYAPTQTAQNDEQD